MATTTPNFNLRKPAPADRVSVTTDLSENFDKIDAHDHDVDYEPSGTVATHAGLADPHPLYLLEAAASIVVANRQTASYTLALADAGLVIEMNVATANDLTVPPNSTVAFPVGTVLEVLQYGAGQTTLVAGAGVTIRSSGAKLKISAQYGSAALRKIGTDEWAAAGELSA